MIDALPTLAEIDAALAERLLGEALAKYNPNHRPAGNPDGGQFAPADGGGGGGSAPAGDAPAAGPKPGDANDALPTHDEIKAVLEKYKGNGYMDINNGLRNDDVEDAVQWEPVLVLHPNEALPLAPHLAPGSWVLNERMPIACGCILPDGVVECSFHKSPLALAEDVGDLPELVRLAARLEPGLRRTFMDAAHASQNAVDLEALATALRSGQYAEAEVLARLDLLTTRLGGLDPILRQGFLQGAATAHATLAAHRIVARFDLVNPAAVAWAERAVGDLIVQITTPVRDAIREIIRTSVAGAEDVAGTARAIRDVIGLDPRRASAVARFRAGLEAADARNVDRRVERYARAQLRQRAEVIARTETLTATHRGQEALWHEARRQGLLDPAETRRVWIVTDDDRLDEECEVLDGETAALDGAFPGGVDGPPLHPQCRCSEGLVFEK